MSASLLIVAVVAIAVSALCRRYGLSSPLVLVTVGLAMGWIPGLPTPELEPELVLYLILPPLLYSAAQESSYQAIRDRWRGIATLAVALPLVMTAVVGYVAYLTTPVSRCRPRSSSARSSRLRMRCRHRPSAAVSDCRAR